MTPPACSGGRREWRLVRRGWWCWTRKSDSINPLNLSTGSCVWPLEKQS